MKKIYLLACFLLLTISCQKDEIDTLFTDTDLQEQKLELVKFNDLPENILKNFDDENSIEIHGEKSSSLFGKINKNKKVKKIKLKNGTTTHTFSLSTKAKNSTQKASKGYYFDNLVIKANLKKRG